MKFKPWVEWDGEIEWMLTSILYLIVVFCLFAVYIVYHHQTVVVPKQIAWNARCEQAGGEPIRNARRIGKSQSVSFVCLKKEIVLEIK